MFLKSVHIKNVRCIQDIRISFENEDNSNRKWTIIVGDNGGGKTTILKAIAFLLGGTDAWVELFEHPDVWIRNGADKCTISAVLTTAKNEERTVSVTIKRGDSLRTLYQRNEDSMASLDRALRHTDRNYFTVGYGVTRRLSDHRFRGASSHEFRSPRALAVGTLFSSRITLVCFETWVMSLDDQHSKDMIEMVHHAMHGLLPNVTFDGVDKVNRRLMFDTLDGPVPLLELSQGNRDIIGWVGDLLSKIVSIFDDYKNPFDIRGLLLIDELELHLHPSWQRRLIDFLTDKLPRLQLIVTTNSPMLAHQAHENELHFLRRHNKQGPRIHQFEGCPNKLLLQQLIVSPVFGLDTAHSYVVERHRAEFKSLNASKRLGTKDRKRRKYLIDSLEEVSKWNEVTEKDRQMNRLLTRIEQKLNK